MAVSQPYAGAWLNAVPKFKAFKIHTWAMRLMVQRRLGLPLTAQVPEGERSRHGRAFDVMGDLATNDGKSGHQSRHHSVLVELVTRLRSSWGSAVEYEPAGYKGYSDTRPDLTVDTRDGRKIGDVKIKDPIGSDPTDVGRRGAYVDFGNTAPSSHDQRCKGGRSADARARRSSRRQAPGTWSRSRATTRARRGTGARSTTSSSRRSGACRPAWSS